MLAFVAVGSVRRWLTEYSEIGAPRADTASSSSSSSHPRSAFDEYAHRFGVDSAHQQQQHTQHITVGVSQPLADADAAAALFAASFAAPEVHALFDSGVSAVGAAATAPMTAYLPVEEGSASGSGSVLVDKQQTQQKQQRESERGWSAWWCDELPRLERLARALPMLQARRRGVNHLHISVCFENFSLLFGSSILASSLDSLP